MIMYPPELALSSQRRYMFTNPSEETEPECIYTCRCLRCHEMMMLVHYHCRSNDKLSSPVSSIPQSEGLRWSDCSPVRRCWCQGPAARDPASFACLPEHRSSLPHSSSQQNTRIVSLSSVIARLTALTHSAMPSPRIIAPRILNEKAHDQRTVFWSSISASPPLKPP